MKITNERHILSVENADLSGSNFRDVNLSASTFADANLWKTVFEDVSLANAKFHGINFTNVEITDCNLQGMTIDGIPIQAALDAYRRSLAATTKQTPPSTGPLQIRPFDGSDEPAVIALWKSVFGYTAPHNDPALTIRQKLAVDPDLFLVAIHEGNLIGTVMGGYDGHRGWIYSLAVDPNYRNHGAGRALVGSVERMLAARGCVKVNLQLLASNTPTTGFYEKLGYKIEDRTSMGKLLE